MKIVKNNRSKYSLALFFSIFLHFFGFGLIYKNIFQLQTHKNSKSQNLVKSPHMVQLDSVKFITQKQLQEIKILKNKQIVANELSGKKEFTKDSRFAGEMNQTFERQTISSNNGAFQKAGLGKKDGSLESLSQIEKSRLSASKKVQNEKQSKSNIKSLNLSDLGAVYISKIEDEEKRKSDTIIEKSRELTLKVKQNNALGAEHGSSDVSALSRNNDFVEEVPLGDMTNLNTTEFKYYGFYHRIRQKLEQYWGSTIQSKAKNLYKTGRRLPSSENLITAITVTLDDRGNILDIKIDGTSGIRELDQAAIESFNKAGPFPNPPKGLLVGGRAIIQWGFVVKS